MNVTILGTGKMGRAIAARLVAGGNNVTFLSRNPQETVGVVKTLESQAKQGAKIRVNPLDSRIADSVVFNTLWYPIAQTVVKQHAADLHGKVLVDTTNPLNQTFDDLATPPDSSAAEEIAKIAPTDTQVVKAFNTTFAGLVEQGHVAGEPLDVFVAGDSEPAKATIAKLIEAGGQHAIDVGPLKRARQLEGMAFISIVTQNKLDKPWMTAIKFNS